VAKKAQKISFFPCVLHHLHKIHGKKNQKNKSSSNLKIKTHENRIANMRMQPISIFIMLLLKISEN